MNTRRNTNIGTILAAAAVASLNANTQDRKAESGKTESEVIASMADIITRNATTAENKPVKNHHASCMEAIRSLLGLADGTKVPAKVYESLKSGLAVYVAAKVTAWHAGAIHSVHSQNVRAVKSGVDADGTPALLGTRTTTTLHRKTPEEERNAAVAEMVNLRTKASVLVEKGFDANTTAALQTLASRMRSLRKSAHGLRFWLPNTTIIVEGPLGDHMKAADAAAAAALAVHQAAGTTTAEPTKELASGATVGSRKVQPGKSEVVAKVSKRDSAKVRKAVLGTPLTVK